MRRVESAAWSVIIVNFNSTAHLSLALDSVRAHLDGLEWEALVVDNASDPEFDPAQAQETGAHGLAADLAGTIYGAEVYSQSVKKYVR